MGVMKELKQRQAKTNPKPAGKQKGNGFNYLSYYPTKEQKEEIKAIKVEVEPLTDLLTALLDVGYVVKLRGDTSKNSLSLVILQDVPFGQPCNALSFWHSDLTRIFQQFLFLGEDGLTRWIETGSLSGDVNDGEW